MTPELSSKLENFSSGDDEWEVENSVWLVEKTFFLDGWWQVNAKYVNGNRVLRVVLCRRLERCIEMQLYSSLNGIFFLATSHKLHI